MRRGTPCGLEGFQYRTNPPDCSSNSPLASWIGGLTAVLGDHAHGNSNKNADRAKCIGDLPTFQNRPAGFASVLFNRGAVRPSMACFTAQKMTNRQPAAESCNKTQEVKSCHVWSGLTIFHSHNKCRRKSPHLTIDYHNRHCRTFPCLNPFYKLKRTYKNDGNLVVSGRPSP